MTQNALKGNFEPFDASKWRIGLVVAQFNNDITSKLEQSAIERAADYGIQNDMIDVQYVAGAVEIPLVLQHMAKSGNYQALLAVGCVVRGATPHFDYVCSFVNQGILRVQLDESMPIGFGVLTCNNEAEANERMHLGGEHLDAVLQQAKLMQ